MSAFFMLLKAYSASERTKTILSLCLFKTHISLAFTLFCQLFVMKQLPVLEYGWQIALSMYHNLFH